jgi:hypothetical protein
LSVGRTWMARCTSWPATLAALTRQRPARLALFGPRWVGEGGPVWQGQAFPSATLQVGGALGGHPTGVCGERYLWRGIMVDRIANAARSPTFDGRSVPQTPLLRLARVRHLRLPSVTYASLPSPTPPFRHLRLPSVTYASLPSPTPPFRHPRLPSVTHAFPSTRS